MSPEIRARLISQTIMSMDQEGRITFFDRKYSEEEIERILNHIKAILINKTDKFIH